MEQFRLRLYPSPSSSYALLTSIELHPYNESSNEQSIQILLQMSQQEYEFAAVGARGLRADRLRELSCKRYKPQANRLEVESSNPAVIILRRVTEEICPICLNHLKKGQFVRELPCLHVYHKSCIDRWLTDHSSCPLDRKPLD